MEEIQKLIDTLKKDAEKSQQRISKAQSEIQGLVKIRKDKRQEWETEDAALEGDISELVQEISEIQGRVLASEEFIKILETPNSNK